MLAVPSGHASSQLPAPRGTQHPRRPRDAMPLSAPHARGGLVTVRALLITPVQLVVIRVSEFLHSQCSRRGRHRPHGAMDRQVKRCHASRPFQNTRQHSIPSHCTIWLCILNDSLEPGWARGQRRGRLCGVGVGRGGRGRGGRRRNTERPASPAGEAHWTAAPKGRGWNHPIQTARG